jgi:hypothetical protein
VNLSPATRATLFGAMDLPSKFLLALNAKANRTGTPVFAGVDPVEKARRRAAGKVAKAQRKVNRA